MRSNFLIDCKDNVFCNEYTIFLKREFARKSFYVNAKLIKDLFFSHFIYVKFFQTFSKVISVNSYFYSRIIAVTFISGHYTLIILT